MKFGGKDSGTSRPMPGAAQLARNLAAQAKASAVALVREGRLMASTEESRARLEEHCHPCEKYDEPTKRCVECGCYVEYKVALVAGNCPLGKF
jgi:hypothetical protein